MRSKKSISRYFTLLAVCLCLLYGAIAQPPANATLKMIQELFRHGARENIYDKYDGGKYFVDEGELLPVGIRQHFTLGQILRNEYMYKKQLIPTTFNHSLMYIRSTDVNRTIMSAYSQLYGIFPETLGPNVPSGINNSLLLPPYTGAENFAVSGMGAIPNNIQAIPVHVVPQNKDLVLRAFSSDPCPMQKTWQSQNSKNEKVLNSIRSTFNQSISKFIQLNPQLNATISNITTGQIAETVDVYFCDIYANRPVPSEYMNDAQYQFDLNLIYSIDMYYSLFGQEIQRQVAGSAFFEEIVKNFNNSALNAVTEKWMIYSAHDSTVASMLSYLNFTSWQCIMGVKNNTYNFTSCKWPLPPFASNLIFELWEVQPSDPQLNQQLLVFIQYNGQYVDARCQRSDLGCQWETWKNKVMSDRVQNLQSTCGIESNSDENDQSLPYWGLITLISLSSLIIVLLIVITILFRKFSNVKMYKSSDNSFDEEKLDI